MFTAFQYHLHKTDLHVLGAGHPPTMNVSINTGPYVWISQSKTVKLYSPDSEILYFVLPLNPLRVMDTFSRPSISITQPFPVEPSANTHPSSTSPGRLVCLRVT